MTLHNMLEEINRSAAKDILRLHVESENIRFFNLGRHAIKAALKSIGIKSGDAVLLPSFICKEVLAPIYECGAKPIFYDVDRRLDPIGLPIIENIRAILAVNYFGFPQNLAVFNKYCANNNVALIEDNAHSFLSADINGKALGTRGDYGITSYRKILPIAEGASLLLNSNSFRIKGDQIPLIYKPASAAQNIRILLNWVEKRIGIRILPLGKSLLRKFRRFRTGYEIGPSNDEYEHITPQPENPPAYLRDHILHVNAYDEITKRRLLYKEFHQQLSAIRIEPVFSSLNQGICPYGYPFYADDVIAKEAVKIARKAGFDCFRWPELPSSVQTSTHPHYHQLWVINFLC
jgi:hypothetical protein